MFLLLCKFCTSYAQVAGSCQLGRDESFYEIPPLLKEILNYADGEKDKRYLRQKEQRGGSDLDAVPFCKYTTA